MSRIIRDVYNKRGNRQVTIELYEGEQIRVANKESKILVIENNEHYRLGYPVEDVVPAHVIQDARAVTWCPLDQDWVE